MSKLAVFSGFLALALSAHGQMFSHGVPASVTSPEPDGRQHGVPASVVSPTTLPPGVHPQAVFRSQGPLRHFGDRHRRHVFVPIPVFYPVYPLYGDGAYPVADPAIQAPDSQTPVPDSQDRQAAADSEDALRQAYLQGARDALKQERDDTRYGEHYMDSRERAHATESDDLPARTKRQAEASAPSAAKEDAGPATVFIFKDGRQIETHNFAIMGQTLYDFSSTGLKKVELADLDKEKTLKANDDRGVIVKLP
jgi:hypothetical protein